jgi:hypothetical protein
MHGGRVHPQRMVVPMPKPFDAPPGVLPYARFLQTLNRAEAFQSNTDACKPIVRGCDRVQFSPSARLLPKLGEVLPVQGVIASAPTQAQPIHQQVRQQVIPSTGRLLDVYL